MNRRDAAIFAELTQERDAEDRAFAERFAEIRDRLDVLWGELPHHFPTSEGWTPCHPRHRRGDEGPACGQQRLGGVPEGCGVMTADDRTVRAYLDHDKWLDSLTDEQREIRARRLRILGSIDDTYALNRAERDRGAASLLAVCACLVVAVSFAPEWWQRIAEAALFAFGLGCWLMIRGARHGVAIRDRLDAEAPKRWDR